MASKCNSDWQSTKKTVLQRNAHMFNNPFISDIKFSCGDSTRKYFHAHKYVLATSSTVFYAMFYGDLAEKDSTIHLPDTDDESLEAFLRFLYTDDCKMTAEIAIKVMYLAKKYIVPSLTEKCVEVIQESLQPDNVVTVLEQALKYDEKKLEKKCWEVVELQTRKVVFSEAFCRISQGTLINILKRDHLSGIEEIELFKAVLKWSDAQCGRNDLEATGENRKAVIGEGVYEIRFLSMSQNDFAQYVSRSGLLTAEEVISIYDKFNGLESADLKWKQRYKRADLKYFKRFSLKDVNVPGVSWSYSGQPDRLSFSVNKLATFHGVYLFGDAKGSKYWVSFEVGDVKVNVTYTSKVNSEGVYGCKVMLPTPISLEQDKVVTIAAKITGPNSYYGKRATTSEEIDGVIVTFSNVSEPRNGTDKTMGQFYAIILSI